MFKKLQLGYVLLLGALCYLFTFPKTYAQNILPLGAQIIEGNASVNYNGRSMLVASEHNKNIISWDSFNVGENNRVFFDENHYLNLVRGSEPSIIAGIVNQSESGGSFTLVNPNGITLSTTGIINAREAMLSTSKATPKIIGHFLDTGNLLIEGKGMGKIKVNGTVHVNSLVLDGSQIIIRDLGKIKNRSYNNEELGNNQDQEFIKISSSTHRIDVGGAPTLDLEKDYGFYEKDGFVNHLGATPVSTKEEFLKIALNPDGHYFITDDINLGTISEPISYTNAFSGTIDGAFNTISYNLNLSEASSENIGLFPKISHATIEDLKIADSSIYVKKPLLDLNIGGLAGSIDNSTLKNFEVANFDLHIDEPGTHTFNLGAVGGRLDSNNLQNLSAYFSDNTRSLIDRSTAFNAGSIGGSILGNSTSGVISAKDIFKKETAIPLFGIAPDNSSLAATPLNDSGFLSVNPEVYLEDEGYFTHQGFYAPYFLDDDIEITYDPNDPRAYNYTDLVDNPYYRNSDFVNISYDYQGAMLNPDIYAHTYTAKANGVHFYFQKGLERGFSLKHLVTIKDPRENIKVPEPAPVISDLENSNDNIPVLRPEHDISYSFDYTAPRSPAPFFVTSPKLNYDKNTIYQQSEYKNMEYLSTLSFFNRFKNRNPALSRSLMAALYDKKEDELKNRKDKQMMIAKKETLKKSDSTDHHQTTKS